MLGHPAPPACAPACPRLRAADRRNARMSASLSRIAAILILLAGPVWPAAAADFYQGKQVTIIVGFTPGGTYDLTARLYARHIGRYLPGKPAVLVQNMPGAGSLVAAANLYNVA